MEPNTAQRGTTHSITMSGYLRTSVPQVSHSKRALLKKAKRCKINIKKIKKHHRILMTRMFDIYNNLTNKKIFLHNMRIIISLIQRIKGEGFILTPYSIQRQTDRQTVNIILIGTQYQYQHFHSLVQFC